MNENHKIKRFDEPLDVLVLEDTSVDKRLIESMLAESRNYASKVEIIDSLSDALLKLGQENFDIVLIDLNVTDSKGIETLKQIRSKDSCIPIVVNTGAFEDNLGIEALLFGAQDFLVKGDYNAKLLNKVLHYAVERKRLEGELKAANKKVADAQAQLIQIAKMEVVGELATGVAHEVKNPLSIIAYGLTYLEQKWEKKDDSIKEVFKNMDDAIHRADNIITDLLDFSSLSSLHKQKNDLQSVIDHAILLTKYELEKKNVKIIKSFDDDVSQLNMDSHRIQQVIINLILNAIAALPKGGTIGITIKKERLQGESINRSEKTDIQIGDEVLCVAVKDNGSGINDEEISQVYDPFFTTKRAKGGVGLGLSVSRQIMELHNGLLDIRNNGEGSGVTAFLYFKA